MLIQLVAIVQLVEVNGNITMLWRSALPLCLREGIENYQTNNMRKYKNCILPQALQVDQTGLSCHTEVGHVMCM